MLKDSFERDTIRLGYYASADAGLPVNKTVDLVLRARYDLLPEMHLGNDSVSALVDVSGWSIWLGCSRRW